MNNVISITTHPRHPINKYRTFIHYDRGEMKKITKKFIPLIHRSPEVRVPGKEEGAVQHELHRAFPMVSKK